MRDSPLKRAPYALDRSRTSKMTCHHGNGFLRPCFCPSVTAQLVCRPGHERPTRSSDFRPASNCPSGQYLPHKIRFPLSRVQRRRRLWVKLRRTQKEQMISALPPTSDIARQPRLTNQSHLRLTPLLADAERREAVVFRHHH